MRVNLNVPYTASDPKSGKLTTKNRDSDHFCQEIKSLAYDIDKSYERDILKLKV